MNTLERPPNALPPITLFWILCAITIFSLSIFGTTIQHWLFSHISRNAILPFVACITPLLTIILYFQRQRLSLRLPALLVACVLIALGILAVVFKYLRPVELTHFFLFATLGWLSISAFGPRTAIGLVIIIATGDEILQHFLPSRVGDLHDILINNLSGMTGIFLGSGKRQQHPLPNK